MTVYDIDGRVEMSLFRGLSIADVIHDTWRRAAVLDIDSVNDLYVLDAKEHLSIIKRMRDFMFFYTLMGFGDPVSEVGKWFHEPSQCAWVQDVPMVLNAPELGLGPVEVRDVRGSIDGRVSFVVALMDDEVDFTLTWDRFLLGAAIDTREDNHEVY